MKLLLATIQRKRRPKIGEMQVSLRVSANLMHSQPRTSIKRMVDSLV
jgi:hypothetical protein